MEGLIKVWRQATAKAHISKLATIQTRTGKGGRSRIDIAMRVLRKGSISRTGNVMESKGLGDLLESEDRYYNKWQTNIR